VTSSKKSKIISETDIPNIGIVQAGKLVNHPVFGNGKINEIAKFESGEITINIQFDTGEPKWLVPEFANLQEQKKKIWLSSLLGK